MAADATLEAIPAERLKAELTRRVAERLAPTSKRKIKRGPGPAVGASRERQAPDADLGVAIGGQHDTVQAEGGRIDGAEVLRIIRHAVDELLEPATQVFLLHGADRELAPLISAVMEQVPGVVRARRQALTERNIESLVDVYLGADPLAAAMPNLERDNAEAQARFLKVWPVLSAEDVAQQAGHGSRNRSATASRWKAARKIFGMRASGREVYPAFQFHDGRPRPVIGRILQTLPASLTGWRIAFWFVGPNGWLDGRAPVDCLDDEAAVLVAAERESDAWMG